MFVRNDLARRAGGIADGGTSELAWPGAIGPVERLALAPNQVIRGPFQGAVLDKATDVAVAPDGAWVVADAGNHRVLVFDSHGFLRSVIGEGPCAMTTSDRTGCTDPDGDGPLAVGDGQLNEPWGVAVGDSGDVFVADTWNGRIQVFDRDGVFLRKWGRFGMASTATDEPLLYGPRGIELDDAGNLVVADTGNKRLLVFTPDGRPVHTLGHEGHESDAFDEPVGLARDANHTLLVADAWNRRIKRLDVSYRVLAIWEVPGWQSRGATDKPYVATDAAGTVYASDPAGGRILIFTPAGQLTASLDLTADGDDTARPTGIVVDHDRNSLLVLDHAGGRLLVYPLPRSGS
jgi:DNA-binding beta-propeller fold protein YncE